MNFVTGVEIYSWSSQSLGNQPLTSIQSMWVDASNVITGAVGGQRVLINLGQTLDQAGSGQAGGGRQVVIEIPGSSQPNTNPNIGPSPRQGFFLVPASMPFIIQISCTLNATGPIDVQLYNFNVFALGIKHAKDVIKWLDKQSGKEGRINTGAVKS